MTPGFPENEAETNCIPALQDFFKQFQATQLFEISVITFQYPYRKENYLWHGIKVYSLGGKNRKGLMRYLNWLKVLKLADEINEHKPIIQVHSFWFNECAYIGNKIALKLDIPHSCTFMGQDALKENQYFKKIKKLPLIVTLSGFHAKTLMENAGIETNFIIPWGINDIELPARSNREIDILGVGNLIPLKAFDRFIRVVKEVRTKLADVKAEIVGNGPEIQNLQKLIDAYGMTQNIHMRGELDRAGVLKKMGQSKCLLHLSEYESFGMVLIEALSLNVKVFSSNVGIAPEIQEISIVEGEKEASYRIVEFLLNKESVLQKINYSIKSTVDSYIEQVFVM